jgi:5-methylthioadenosine/S-adenosylhomocysteine deaminase
LVDILLKDVYRVITGGSGRILKDATIAIDGGKIVEVSKGRSSSGPGDHVIDGRGKAFIALPGLVNAHVHTEETLGMNLIPDTLRHVPWFESWTLPYYEQMGEKDAYWSALLSQMKMLESGTTCYSDSANRYPELAAEAAERSGIRAKVAKWASDIDGQFSSSTDRCLKESEDLLRRFSRRRGRVGAIAAVIGANQCSNELYNDEMELAKKYDVPVTSHEASGHEDVVRSLKRVGRRPIENLDRIGFLSPRTILSHLTDLTNEEVSMIARSRTKGVMCPVSELKKGKGFSKYSKLARMLEEGVEICVGTDTANSSNHFNVLRTVNLLLLLSKDLSNDPATLDAGGALDMVTQGAAKALGLKRVGRIEEGGAADIALFEVPKMAAFSYDPDPIQGMVFGDESKAQITIVDGEVVYDSGRFLKVDEEEVAKECTERAERIRRRILE